MKFLAILQLFTPQIFGIIMSVVASLVAVGNTYVSLKIDRSVSAIRLEIAGLSLAIAEKISVLSMDIGNRFTRVEKDVALTIQRTVTLEGSVEHLMREVEMLRGQLSDLRIRNGNGD